MTNRFFAYSTCYGYSIVEVEVEGQVTPDLVAEAERIARCLYENEDYSTDVSVLRARLFVTDGEPFSFKVLVSPDHRRVDIEVKCRDGDSEKIETETLRV